LTKIINGVINNNINKKFNMGGVNKNGNIVFSGVHKFNPGAGKGNGRKNEKIFLLSGKKNRNRDDKLFEI